ncbi:MAG: phage holin family protein [Chloroflexota bacterium]|nr:phage holin family protein [Chloroflexota bacterium]
MGYLLIRLIINAIALYAATRIVPGLTFDGHWTTIALVAFIFGVVNALVRPLIEVLTCPLILLTLGLFTFVINALMLLLTGWIADQFGLGFHVAGFVPALIGALVVSLVSFVLNLVVTEATGEATA